MNLALYQQTLTLAHASLRVRYRQTWVGFLWVILHPVILLCTQALVFSYIFKIEIFDFMFYFASGLLPWFFISQTLEMGTSQLRVQSQSIKSYFIQPYTFTLALTLENLVTFATSILLIMVPLIIYQNQPIWTLLFWILNIIPLAVTAAAITFMLASSNVIFRDIRFIVSFVLSIAYFVTPIFYKIDLLPTEIANILQLNPFHILLSPFQTLTLNLSLQLWAVSFLKSLCLMGVVLVLAKLHWRRIKNSFYLNL